jgi:hypothetical protein
MASYWTLSSTRLFIGSKSALVGHSGEWAFASQSWASDRVSPISKIDHFISFPKQYPVTRVF